MTALYTAFVDKDCSIAEINPLVVTGDGSVMALDAKLNFDSNALFRHKDILELRDLDEEDEKEIQASKFDLSYIALDGNIGCMYAEGYLVKDAPRLPLNLLDALRAYDADEGLKQAIGAEFSAAYLKLKHQEWNAFCSHFTQWERDSTLDI